MSIYELARDDVIWPRVAFQQYENICMSWVRGQRGIATNQSTASPLEALVRNLHLNGPGVAAPVVSDQEVGPGHIA